MKPLVSIIILNYNGEHFLKDTLIALKNTSYQPIEVIIVDNASTDDSLNIIRQFDFVTLIESKENLGFAEGNNVGIRKAAGKYICLVNNDLKVTPGWLDPLIDFLENHPDYAAVQPKILSWQDETLFEYAGGAGGFLDRYGYPFTRGRILRYCEKDLGQYDSAARIFWASGACFCLRKDVIDKVGLLDKDFFLHQEEVDWCWRMNLAGFKIAAIPSSVVFHHGGGALNYGSPVKLYFNYRNNLAMLLKNMEIITLLSILPVRLLLDFGAIFHNIVQGKLKNTWSIIRGYFSILRNSKAILTKRRTVQNKIRVIKDSDLKPVLYSKSIILSYYLGKKSFLELDMPEAKIEESIEERSI